jgi:hypothetical protein
MLMRFRQPCYYYDVEGEDMTNDDAWAERKADEIRARQQKEGQRRRTNAEEENFLLTHVEGAWNAVQAALKSKITALNQRLGENGLTFSLVDDRTVEIGLKGRSVLHTVRFDSLRHSIDAPGFTWEVKAANGQIVFAASRETGAYNMTTDQVAAHILDDLCKFV